MKNTKIISLLLCSLHQARAQDACDLSFWGLSNCGPFDAIVVGAGMSGLAAAATLLDRGKTVVVLEGRDVVGGRMRTKTDFGEPAGDYYTGTIELGANWIYGGYGRLDEYDTTDSGVSCAYGCFG